MATQEQIPGGTQVINSGFLVWGTFLEPFVPKETGVSFLADWEGKSQEGRLENPMVDLLVPQQLPPLSSPWGFLKSIPLILNVGGKPKRMNVKFTEASVLKNYMFPWITRKQSASQVCCSKFCQSTEHFLKTTSRTDQMYLTTEPAGQSDHLQNPWEVACTMEMTVLRICGWEGFHSMKGEGKQGC